MLRHITFAVSIAATALAQSDDDQNPSVEIASCQALECTPPDGSICSTGEMPGPPVGIGMASQAINSSSSGSLSFTLIDGLHDNGFTGIGSSEYEYSDQQLFVGVDPNADSYPSGCVLMMQYMGQTLPIEPVLDDDTRPGAAEGTTSCQGVVNPLCRDEIIEIIQDFNDSSSNGEIQCGRLVEHVNTELRGSTDACGGDGGWISNFFNVTGGSLPRSNSSTASAERLGSDECKPVLPASNDLYKVAEMRQFFFADPPEAAADFMGRLYGGRTGWTPVMTVVYGDGEDENESPDVSFLCMETFNREGEKRESPLDSAGNGLVPGSLLMAAGPLLAALAGAL